jgi:integrase
MDMVPQHSNQAKKTEMAVRKRTWTAPDGASKEAWIADYRDQHRRRHIKTFRTRREADAYAARTAVAVRAGTHTADRDSVTVSDAGVLWVETAIKNGLERATLVHYRQHLDLHIAPLIGDVRLSQLTIPAVRDFEDRLARERSAALVRKIMVSLSSIVTDAQERGLVAQNVVRELQQGRRRGRRGARADKRQRAKLKVGIDIPTPAEIAAIIAHLSGPARPLLLTAIFTGLRASELRGLRWSDIDLKRATLHVHQRADRYQQIGRPKSAAGERTVPLPPLLANTLREWKLACPPASGLVFPSRTDMPLRLDGIIERFYHPAQVAADVVDAEGRAKYTGLHALRHFYTSWCINRRADGGLELPLKVVQARLGHATIQLTADRYGHLFPSADDGTELAAAEKALMR